jgi:hypothetical protein
MSQAVFDPNGRLKNLTIHPEDVPDEAWTLESISADGLRKTYLYFDEPSGLMLRKVENLVEESLLQLNQQQFNDSIGRRWGDGKVAARIPINVYMREFAPRRRQGDNDFAKWFLNRDENRPYRTFKGRV